MAAMRRNSASCLGLVLCLGCLWSLAARSETTFDKAASREPVYLQQGKGRSWCPRCGMHLGSFYKTSHALTDSRGQTRQFCSIHCLAAELTEHPTEASDRIRVVDASTEQWIDARTAHYLVESRIPGTMSRVSKLAFADRATAEEFRSRYGGRIVDFQSALELARTSLQTDRQQVQARKRRKLVPAGKRIASQRCPGLKVHPEPDESLAALKVRLLAQPGCGRLDESSLHRLALYLLDVQGRDKPKPGPRLQANESERCPVCGMFVHPYPHWLARVEMADGKRFHFDGAKDLFKFVLQPGRFVKSENPQVKRFWVTDYYNLNALEGRKAWYVIGGDVLGPMGHELIPFATRAEAEIFRSDHGGTRILTADQVTAPLLQRLDQGDVTRP